MSCEIELHLSWSRTPEVGADNLKEATLTTGVTF